MIIAVDFDGTIVEDRYPEIGRELPFATETLRMLVAEGHRLVLWTCREDELLAEALEWCRQRGVEFWAVNRDYPEETVENNPRYTRKLKADLFIDDRNVGGLPDWGVIYGYINDNDNVNVNVNVNDNDNVNVNDRSNFGRLLPNGRKDPWFRRLWLRVESKLQNS